MEWGFAYNARGSRAASPSPMLATGNQGAPDDKPGRCGYDAMLRRKAMNATVGVKTTASATRWSQIGVSSSGFAGTEGYKAPPLRLSCLPRNERGGPETSSIKRVGASALRQETDDVRGQAHLAVVLDASRRDSGPMRTCVRARPSYHWDREWGVRETDEKSPTTEPLGMKTVPVQTRRSDPGTCT